jgi:hypothetical protein
MPRKKRTKKTPARKTSRRKKRPAKKKARTARRGGKKRSGNKRGSKGVSRRRAAKPTMPPADLATMLGGPVMPLPGV